MNNTEIWKHGKNHHIIALSCLTIVADGAVFQGNFNKQPDSFPTIKVNFFVLQS
jgi:hypothetical protein